MTHTLHRTGGAESLKNDFVVLAITCQTVNAKGSAPKFKAFADIVLKHNPVNFGDMRTGSAFGVGVDEVRSGFRDNSIVHAVFTDEETVAAVLKELKDADLGVSIVVSGLLRQTAQCCNSAGLEPHTVEHSLGIFGRTELLPRETTLEVGTMCGHGLIAFSLIEEIVERIRGGSVTAKQAADELARQCHCGVFNPDRAARILAEAARREGRQARQKSSMAPAGRGGTRNE